MTLKNHRLFMNKRVSQLKENTISEGISSLVSGALNLHNFLVLVGPF
jgi:hypothetical protein